MVQFLENKKKKNGLHWEEELLRETKYFCLKKTQISS